MVNILRSVLWGTARRIALAYRLGGRALLLAPLIVAPAVLTELAQHGAEFHLGMFASRDAFHALAMDPTRWAFGYAKIAGFLVTMLGVARFWAVEGVARLVPRIGGRFLVRASMAIAACLLLSLLQRWFDAQGSVLSTTTNVANFLIQCGLTVYILGALFGDGGATLRWSFTTGWPRVVTTTVLPLAAFVPCQLLHLFDHRIAIGAPVPVVVLAMLWDSLFVGLFAALTGSALFVGYRYGPSWRGWDRPI